MSINRLIEIMARLRTPGTGCPWDLEQNFSSIAPFTIEEAYEVADAIERGDMEDLKEELGDLLLQVAFHARMAQEAGLFGFDDVAQTICEKLVRRHPHVFQTKESLTAETVVAKWSDIKAREKAERVAQKTVDGEETAAEKGTLDGVPLPLPALTRAVKLQQKAAKVGFDWKDTRLVLEKLREETAEVEAELPFEAGAAPTAELTEEVGDLLFVVANLARHLKVDPEQALRGANAKFERRFRHIETRLAAEGKTPVEATLEEMEALWVEAKQSGKRA